jgi:hypothetical protein
MPRHLAQGPRWTPEDDQKLRKVWGRRAIDTIAAALGRTSCAVQQRAQHLELGSRLNKRTTLTRFAKESGYDRSRIVAAAVHLGIKFRRAPRMWSRPGTDTRRRRLIVSAAQREMVLEFLAGLPDGERLYSGLATRSRVGEWGTGRKPPACRRCQETTRPHCARGLCTRCRQVVHHEEPPVQRAA